MPRGRPPDPTRLKIIRGTLEAGRLNPDEPQPLAGIPVCPEWIGTEARAVWDELVRVIGEARILTQADQWLMVRFAQAAARWKAAEIQLDAFKSMRAKGYRAVYVVMKQEWADMNNLAGQLGLSPGMRSKLKSFGVSKPAKNDKSKFFAGREQA